VRGTVSAFLTCPFARKNEFTIRHYAASVVYDTRGICTVVLVQQYLYFCISTDVDTDTLRGLAARVIRSHYALSVT
jgi:hypothetical protein